MDPRVKPEDDDGGCGANRRTGDVTLKFQTPSGSRCLAA